MRLDVNIDEVREVLENVGHGGELIAALWASYFIIYSWLLIVLETRFKNVFD